jgi:hypothetical protein
MKKNSFLCNDTVNNTTYTINLLLTMKKSIMALSATLTGTAVSAQK